MGSHAGFMLVTRRDSEPHPVLQDPGEPTGWSVVATPVSGRASGWKWVPIVAVAAILSMVRWCPSTRILENDAIGVQEMVARVPGMVGQLEDPWVGLSGSRRFSTYTYVATRWRLLPPLIGHIAHMPPSVYLALPRLGAWWLLLLGVWYAWKLGSAKAAWISALLVAGSTPWLTAVDNVQFDGWVAGMLLIVAFTPSRLTAWSFAALGPWMDERFVLFLPVALLVRAATTGESPWREASGVIPYAAVRLVALLLGDAMAAPFSLAMRDWRFGQCAVGWFWAWRLAWPILILGGARVVQRCPAWLAVGAVLGVAAAALLATDYTRTAAGLVPTAVLGAGAAVRDRRLWLIALTLVALNFALPYWHIIAGTRIPVTPVWVPPPPLLAMPFHVR